MSHGVCPSLKEGNLFLVDGTSHVGRRANVLGNPSCGWFPLWTEEGALAGTA